MYTHIYIFDRQCVPTRRERGGESGEDQEFCLLAAFFSGLTTRPHFLSRRGKELKSKVYHWFSLPANAAYCAMLWPYVLAWKQMWGVSSLTYWRMGEAGCRQPARKRTSSAAKFQAGVEVSLNCYHADLESFLQLPGSNSWFVHSAIRTENSVMLLTSLLPLPLSECILWSYTFSLTVISLGKRVWLPFAPCTLSPHAHFLKGSTEELSNLTKVTLFSILWLYD